MQTSCLYKQLYPLNDLKTPFPEWNILTLFLFPELIASCLDPLPACPTPSHQMDLPWTSPL